ncbi:MAG: hypothetical protein NXI35_07935 [bacterium]|nr:hypothetical protein [bacterium]
MTTHWTWTTYGLLTLGAAALMTAGCPSPEENPQGAGGTEGGTESVDTEASSTEEPDTEEPDTDELATDTGEPGTDTDEPGTDTDAPLPSDCSCYDPSIDAGLDIGEECLAVEDALPGCASEPPPCETITQADAGSGGDATVGPEDAVLCLADRLAAGESPAFVLSVEEFSGSDTTHYVPMDDGRYVTFTCGFFDNPPAYQRVNTVEFAGADYFANCIEESPDDAVALFECLQLGITDAEGAMAACE